MLLAGLLAIRARLIENHRKLQSGNILEHDGCFVSTPREPNGTLRLLVQPTDVRENAVRQLQRERRAVYPPS